MLLQKHRCLARWWMETISSRKSSCGGGSEDGDGGPKPAEEIKEVPLLSNKRTDTPDDNNGSSAIKCENKKLRNQVKSLQSKLKERRKTRRQSVYLWASAIWELSKSRVSNDPELYEKVVLFFCYIVHSTKLRSEISSCFFMIVRVCSVSFCRFFLRAVVACCFF